MYSGLTSPPQSTRFVDYPHTPRSLLHLPLETIQGIADECGLGPDSILLDSSIDNVLCNARKLTSLRLTCRWLHNILSTSRYSHTIILSFSESFHNDSMYAIQATLARTRSNSLIHLVVIWSQHPRFFHLLTLFCNLMESLSKWCQLLRLSIRDRFDYRSMPHSTSMSHRFLLFTHQYQARTIRHARIEWSFHIPSMDALPPHMPPLESLTMAMNPELTSSVIGTPKINYASVLSTRLTHLRIFLNGNSLDIQQLLNRCTALTHLQWGTPDWKQGEDFYTFTLNLPALQTVSLTRRGNLPIITAPNVRHAVFQVHIRQPHFVIRNLFTICQSNNMHNLRTLIMCPCIFHGYKIQSFFNSFSHLEYLTLCAAGVPSRLLVTPLLMILEAALSSLRRLEFVIDTQVHDVSMVKDVVSQLITSLSQLEVVCYIYGWEQTTVESSLEDLFGMDHKRLRLCAPWEYNQLSRAAKHLSCPLNPLRSEEGVPSGSPHPTVTVG